MKCLVCGYLGGGFKPDGVTQYLKGVFAGPPSGVEYVISEQQAIRLRDAPEYSFLQGVETIPLRENHLEFKLGGSLEPLGFHVKNILSLGGSEALAGVDLVFTSQGLVYTDIPQVASLDESLIRPQYLTRGRPTDFEDSRALVDGMQKKILWDVVSRGSFKRILAWSERAREDLISVCPGAEEKSSVLRPPVDLPDINSRTGGRDTVRICFVGFDWLRKGLMVLTEVFEDLSRKYDDIELFVATDESFALTEPGPKVRAFYNISHEEVFPKFYADSDIFVLPSRFESFGYSILEAMACALPVVSTNVYAIPELVVDGRTGYLTPYGDAGLLRERLKELIEDRRLRESMGKAGRRRAEKLFSVSVFKKKIGKIFKESI